MTAQEALGFGYLSVFHPDDYEATERHWRSCLETGLPVDWEARMRRFDGTYRRFVFRGVPLRDDAGNIIRWYGANIDIEDYRRADAARERQLIEIINAIPTTAWSTRPDGYCEFLSDRWLDYAGFTSEQAQGWGWAAVVHPDDTPGLTEHWQAALAAGTAVDTEARMRRRDGAYRWFLFRANPMRDESGQIVKWYGTNIDIEDRKRAEEELRRKETMLSKGQRLSATGSFSWQSGTDEIALSEELCRIFEFEQGTAITLAAFLGRVHPEDVRLMSDPMAVARVRDRDFECEVRLLMPNGSVKYVHTMAYVTQDVNGRREIIGAVQEVTDRRLNDEALSKVRSELARVARFRSFGALTATIAHEINQPLAGVITNAGTCLRMLDATPPNLSGIRSTIQRIVSDGKRAADVISRLRQLFTKKGVATEPVDLREAAREVIALSSSELQRHRVVVRAEFEDDVPPVAGDRVQLQQVILNLLLNAAEAMSGIVAHRREIVITTGRGEPDCVLLSVRDAGVGIAGDPGRVFEPFFTTKDGGMGIGLAISQTIVQSHRGRIWATANDGPGVTFSVSIPCSVG
jgi:PAS domain S-box-containing protein